MLERLARVRGLASEAAVVAVWPLSSVDLEASLDAVHEAEQALAAAKLHLIRELEGRDVAGGQGATSMAAWLRGRLRISIRSGRRLAKLAGHLDRRPALDTALGKGEINAEQVDVVASVVDTLPSGVDTDVVDKAETALIDCAAEFDPDGLAKLGRRILAHVAPEVAERAEAEALHREQEKAHAGRGLYLSPLGGARVRITGLLDAEGAAVVRAALDPLCAPRNGNGPDDPRTAAQRRADALVEVCNLALRTDELPDNGGERPHMAVTLPLDALSGQLGAGMLDTGEMLTPEQVRRLACDALIIPAVLGGDGQVLDLGQARRLFTGPIRRALVLRDGGCAFPGCDRPPTWCDGHHIVPWSEGGPTSVDNGVLLCGHHHRVIHHDGWQVRLGADRRPEFLPPPHVDPLRRPRRNTYHQRP